MPRLYHLSSGKQKGFRFNAKEWCIQNHILQRSDCWGVERIGAGLTGSKRTTWRAIVVISAEGWLSSPRWWQSICYEAERWFVPLPPCLPPSLLSLFLSLCGHVIGALAMYWSLCQTETYKNAQNKHSLAVMQFTFCWAEDVCRSVFKNIK